MLFLKRASYKIPTDSLCKFKKKDHICARHFHSIMWFRCSLSWAEELGHSLWDSALTDFQRFLLLFLCFQVFRMEQTAV
jgi:hypothetical protein